MVIIVIMFATFIFLPAPPRFTSPEKMKRQKIIRPVNSSLRLRCKATGNPRPQISWMKDHQELYSRDSGRRSSWTLRLSPTYSRWTRDCTPVSCGTVWAPSTLPITLRSSVRNQKLTSCMSDLFFGQKYKV